MMGFTENGGFLLEVVTEPSFARFIGAAVLEATISSLNFVIFTSAENVSVVVTIISGPNDEVREIALLVPTDESRRGCLLVAWVGRVSTLMDKLSSLVVNPEANHCVFW